MTTPKPEKTFEQWQDDAFSNVLSLTLDNTHPNRSNRLYLKSVADELKEEAIPLLVTRETFDRVLVARLEEGQVVASGIGVFDYLLSSWRMANTVVTNLTGAKGKLLDPAVRDARVHVLKEAQALIVSYMGISLQYPDMFPQFGRPGQRVVVDALLCDPNTAPHNAMPPELLRQIISRFASDGLPEVVAPIITELGLRSIVRANHSLLQPGFRSLLEALDTLVSYPEIAQAVPQMPTFDPEECHGRRMQTGTALGPFLAFSAFPSGDPAITSEYYLDAPDRSQPDREALHSSLRTTVQFLQSALFQIMDKLIRAGAPARTATLQYTLRALATNALRSAMQVDVEKVAGDGFADNLASAWLRLSEPFTRDATLKRIDRVDPDWVCLRALRDAESQGLDDPQNHIGTYWRELTRVNADKESIDKYLERRLAEAGSAEGASSTPGFIADCFFTTASSLHLGPIATISQYKEMLKRIGRYKSELQRIQHTPEMLAPAQRASLPMLMQRWEEELKRMKREKIAMDAQVLDPRRLANMMVFYRFVMCFFLRQVDANKAFPQQHFTMPEETSDKLPENWCMLPEFLVEDPIEFIVFATTYFPDTLTDSTSQVGMGDLRTFDDVLPLFLVTFLARPAYIRNPYLKAKLVDVLHMLTYRDPREDDDYVDTLGGNLPGNLRLHPAIYQFQNVLDHSEVAKTYLVPALLRFYVDIEQTGASSQFYDKLNIRYYIARTLRSLWARGPVHVQATKRFFSQQYVDSQSSSATTTGSQRKDQQVIEEFVARLMTDTTYLLDESLGKLAEIHEIEKKQSERAAEEETGGEADEAVRDQASRLQEAERMASSYVSLAHETVHILAFLSRLVPRPFQAGEVVDRLAAMLNYNLQLLTGPKCSNLRVRDMQARFSFNPRVLLSELTSVYTHLGLPAEHTRRDGDVVAAGNGNSASMSGSSSPLLSSEEESTRAIERFVAAVVEDGRSYSPALFQKTYEILERRSLKNAESLQKLQLFAQKCQAAKVDSSVNEYLEGEAPEKYLDPIMATLILDPVRLPTSGEVMDLAVIKGQLLNDPRDPFNRAQLTVDMLVPLPELKEEIRAWREARLREYYATKQSEQ